MRKINKKYWISLVTWVVIILVAIISTPNVQQLVHDKGQVSIPKSAQSQVAERIQDGWGKKISNTYAIVGVYNNGNKPLTPKQNEEINQTINLLKQNKKYYGIKNITSAMDNAETKKQLISKDKTTQLIQFNISKSHGEIEEISNQLNKAIKIKGLKTYVTGTDILNKDFETSIEKGVKNTEVIAVIFIFFILILVFKSPIVPIVSLLTVGISFLTSLSLVTNLVEKINFPISNFTQVFMVVVLFGIGTDYNILLYDQFKEQLAKGETNIEATKNAVRIAGKTILYSGSAVFIGTMALYFAKFSIYKATSGVAIGVAVLLCALLTLNPVFMVLLGKKMFWPVKKYDGETNSKLWTNLSRKSVLHPIISLGMVLLFTIPFLITYNKPLAYDNLIELSDSLPAKKGVEVVQKHFSKGTAQPSTLYIKTNHTLNNEKDLKTIDELTITLQSIEGVKTVASVTQPGGSQIQDLYIKKQLNTVTNGMNDAKVGLNKISSGLTGASNQLDGNDTQSQVDQVGQLSTGSRTFYSSIVTYMQGVNTLNSGLQVLNTQSSNLQNGSKELNSGISSLQSGSQQLETGLKQMQLTVNTSLSSENQEKLKQLEDSVSLLKSQVDQIASVTSELESLENKINNLPDLNTESAKQQIIDQAVSAAQGSNPNMTEAQEIQMRQLLESSLNSSDLSQVSSQTSQIKSDLQGEIQTAISKMSEMQQEVGVLTTAINSTLEMYDSGMKQIQTALNTAIVPGATALNQGLIKVKEGSDNLNTGIISYTEGVNKAAQGSSELANNSSKLVQGAEQISAGNGQMYQTVLGIPNQINSLSSGLRTSSTGINQVNSGISSANGYLGELEDSNASKVFYIPESKIKSKEFQESIDMYMSDNKESTSMLIVLDNDPASRESMKLVKRLQEVAKANLKGTDLADSVVAIGGQTANLSDTQDIASSDFSRTALIMLLGIFIALMFVTRSILQPLYILGTLILAFVTSIGLTGIISHYFLNESQLTWNTPFFTFIMLISLGVDYSIFLMMKYREIKEGTPSSRIVKSSAIIGTVVLSAAVILSGTFAALIPSGVLTLIQVALSVIIGLIILVIILPIIMSSAISLTYKAKRDL